MAMMNVNRKVNDAFYRYKMPKLDAKVEGKGNGIKTVITNMVEIAKAIYRPPAYPTKFFGCELGAQTQIDKKNDRYIVNGSHTADKLQDILDSFIEKFVLCDACENPETTFHVQPKKEKITSICTACGHQGMIDMRHRLSTYILKNPPTDDSATPQKLKKVKDNQEKAGEEKSTDESGFEGWSDDVPKANDNEKDDADLDWSEDTSEEAIRKREAELGDGIKGLTFNNDLEKGVEERFNIFFQFVKKKIDDNALVDKDILVEAERLDVKDRGGLALAELLFDANILEQIPKHRILFLRFLHNNQKSQKQFMGAIEMIVAQFSTQLLGKVAHILKALYESDYVEEEVMIEWAGKVSKKYVKKDMAEKIHAKAKPFIDWLKTADEESDDDEEDDEVDVVYTYRTEEQVEKEAVKEAEAAKEKMTNGKAASDEEDEDDLDIDDI